MSAMGVSGAGRGLLVNEWLAVHGGAERVFARMTGLFPDADVLCLWDDSRGCAGSAVRETVLARTPLRRRKQLALPFMPAVWRIPQPSYDWALVSTHLFAHHVNVRARSPHCRKILYVHTPARYVWEPDIDRRGDSRLARLAGSTLKGRDARMAADSDVVVANSAFVRDRVRQTWGLDARVIHPPVDVTALQAVPDWAAHATPAEQDVLEALPPAFVLGASRFIAYKRLDLVIRAGEAAGLPVIIAGAGPQERALRAAASTARVPVTLVPAPTDAGLYALYQRASVYVFPPVEDFGLMPVEAMALGTPVVVNPRGGARESVLPDGGAAFPSSRPADLAATVEAAARLAPGTVAATARRFDAVHFDRALREVVLGSHRAVGAGS